MSSLFLYFVSYYTIITTSFLAVTTNASDVLKNQNNNENNNNNNNNNDKLIFKHPRPFSSSSSSSTSSRTLFSLQSMQDLTLQHDASIENLIDSYNNIGGTGSGSGRIDYNDWLSVVLDESVQFCSSSISSSATDNNNNNKSKSKSNSNPCENGLYSSIVDGMRCAVSFRDDTVPYQELLLKYYSSTTSSTTNVKMIQDLVNKAQNELTSTKQMETFFSDWNEMINASSSSTTKIGLELGLIGAQKWVNDIFLNTKDSPRSNSDSKLFNDGTSSCKPKRKLTGMLNEDEDEENDDRLLSEIVVMNIFGGLYAATNAEAAYNEELATTNTHDHEEEEEDNTLDTELAYLISFVATGIPVMITKVV